MYNINIYLFCNCTLVVPTQHLGTHFDGTTLFVNACTCTLQYRATNKPIVIELPLDRSQPARVVSE